MAFETIRFEDITVEDIRSLIDNGVREGISIEYKETQPGSSDDDKRELLADVSSFANAIGGVLLYGIKEERDSQGKTTGLPAEILGCKVDNIDSEVRKLENILRDAIEPRITNIRTKGITLPDGQVVLLFRIPKSLQSPHAVTFKGMMRFYSRNSAGKYPLSVSEVRSSFLHSTERIEEIRRFRINRVAEIIAGQTPINLPEGPKTILHLVPLNPDTQFDLHSLDNETAFITPLHSSGFNMKINFDGLVTYNQSLYTYAQYFRTGAIETTSGFILKPHKGADSFIPSLTFEDDIIKMAGRSFSLFSKIGILPPIAIILTLTQVKGFQMGVSGMYFDKPEPIDRDNLFLPEIIAEDFSNPGRILKPIFDAIWNAAGWPKSHYYDDKGNWVGMKKSS